jgi:hypothetical protein
MMFNKSDYVISEVGLEVGKGLDYAVCEEQGESDGKHSCGTLFELVLAGTHIEDWALHVFFLFKFNN